MPEETATGIALVQMLTEVHQLRALVDMITLATAVCVVRPTGTGTTETPPRAAPRPAAAVRGAHVAIVATPERLRALPPNRPLVRAAPRAEPFRYDPDDYEPDDSDSLDNGPEAPGLPPPIRLGPDGTPL